ncbi:hypothetical protein CSUI_004712 [Cystoisospora suis]|uniref:Transmembrane protein n=1 Tax=Cystoisospora suis TaxID=483139 RepID=A0A2C6L0J6_9APIC|nr:hypothetical protein CSUI_004712 [Cystoisospora suis]
MVGGSLERMEGNLPSIVKNDWSLSRGEGNAKEKNRKGCEFLFLQSGENEVFPGRREEDEDGRNSVLPSSDSEELGWRALSTKHDVFLVKKTTERRHFSTSIRADDRHLSGIPACSFALSSLSPSPRLYVRHHKKSGEVRCLSSSSVSLSSSSSSSPSSFICLSLSPRGRFRTPSSPVEIPQRRGSSGSCEERRKGMSQEVIERGKKKEGCSMYTPTAHLPMKARTFSEFVTSILSLSHRQKNIQRPHSGYTKTREEEKKRKEEKNKSVKGGVMAYYRHTFNGRKTSLSFWSVLPFLFLLVLFCVHATALSTQRNLYPSRTLMDVFFQGGKLRGIFSPLPDSPSRSILLYSSFSSSFSPFFTAPSSSCCSAFHSDLATSSLASHLPRSSPLSSSPSSTCRSHRKSLSSCQSRSKSSLLSPAFFLPFSSSSSLSSPPSSPSASISSASLTKKSPRLSEGVSPTKAFVRQMSFASPSSSYSSSSFSCSTRLLSSSSPFSSSRSSPRSCPSLGASLPSTSAEEEKLSFTSLFMRNSNRGGGIQEDTAGKEKEGVQSEKTKDEWVEELTAGLQSGTLSFPDIYSEVSTAAGGRRLVPRGLDDLIEGAAAVRAGLPLPSHLFEGGGGENKASSVRGGGGEQGSDNEETGVTNKEKDERKSARSPNEGKRTVAAYADEARRLKSNLDGASEEKKEFFLQAYRRELRRRGVDDQDCHTPEDLYNRLAFARVFDNTGASRKDEKTGGAKGDEVIRAEIDAPSTRGRRGGRRSRSSSSRRQRSSRLSSPDDDDEEDEESSSGGRIVQISPGVFMARGGGGSPFDRLFSDFFGGSIFGNRERGNDEDEDEEDDGQTSPFSIGGRRGRKARGGSLLDHLFGGDLFSALLGGGAPGAGEDADDEEEGNASKSRVKKLDFMTPEGAEKKGEKKVSSSYDGGEDQETDPRLLQLVSKAQARGDPSLVLFLRKAFQDKKLREVLLIAQTEGFQKAEAKADERGKYMLHRLKDNDLF